MLRLLARIIFLSLFSSYSLSAFSSDLEFEWSNKDYRQIIADFNGDGLEDYLYQSRVVGEASILKLSAKALSLVEEEGVKYFYHPLPSASKGVHFDSQHRLFIASDFNGDGVADILALQRDDAPTKKSGKPAYLFLGDEAGIHFDQVKVAINKKKGFLNRTSLYDYHAADFNNDGKSDLLATAKHIDDDKDGLVDKMPHDNHYLLLMADDGFVLNIHQVIDPKKSSWASRANQILVKDFNQDGRADLFLQGRTASDKHYLVLSNEQSLLLDDNQREFAANFDDHAWHGEAARLEVGHFQNKDEFHIIKIPKDAGFDPSSAERASYVANERSNIKILQPNDEVAALGFGFGGPGFPEPDPMPSAPAWITIPSSDNDGAFTITWAAVPFTQVNQLFQSKDSGPYTLIYSGSAETYSVSGLSDGSYKYRVRACLLDLCSLYTYSSISTTVYVPPPAPAAPVLSTSSSQVYVNESFNLSWTKPSGSVWQYRLYRDGSPIYPGDSRSLLVSFSSTGQRCYRVSAVNESGEGPLSNQVCTNVNNFPTISITSPSSGHVFKSNQSLIVTTSTSGYVGGGLQIGYRLDSGTINYTNALSYNFGSGLVGDHTLFIYRRFNGVSTQVASRATEVNAVPSILQGSSKSFTVKEDTNVPIGLFATDPNNTNSELTWSLVSEPASGNIPVEGSGKSRSFTYVPLLHYSGQVSFRIRVTDSYR